MNKGIYFKFVKNGRFSFLLICITFNLVLCRSSDYRRPGYNVILISFDTLRADHLGIYGYPKNTSPHIDRFAKKSLLFKNSFSNSSWTLPSHMSLMTSLYPSIHGVVDTSKKLSNSTRTLAEVLKNNDYITAAFTAGFYVSKIYGFDKGFDLYKENYEYAIENPGQGWRLQHIVKSLSSWINANVGEKFFLFIHCYDTHEPFIKHTYLKEFESSYSGRLDFLNTYSDFIKSEEYKFYKNMVQGFFNINIFYNEIINKKHITLSEKDEEHIVALYDNEIRFVDHFFGRLIDHCEHLDLMDKTIIILWSDHGEELFERGKIQHGGLLYDELIHVPLIVYIPNYRGPKVNSVLVQSIDIAPAVLDILDIEPENNFMGISPFSNLNQYVLGQHVQQNIMRTEKYKFMFGLKNSNSLLFDLKQNPEETINISNDEPELVKHYKTKIQRILSRRPRLRVDELIHTKEEIEKLRALGYIK